MLPSNEEKKGPIEARAKKALLNHGKSGWLRSNECMEIVAKDIGGEVDLSEKTRFFNWLKKVEKGRVEGFQKKQLPGNICYIGLENAKVEDIPEFVEEDKKTIRSVKSSFSLSRLFELRANRKQLEKQKNKEIVEKDLRRLECDNEIWTEEWNLSPNEWTQERVWQIRQKWEERFGLNETSTS
jgi:hypothetical protein